MSNMDVVRPVRRAGGSRFFIVAAGVVGAASLGVWTVPGLLQGSSQLPVIDRASAVIDTLRRGDLVVSVHAAGVLVPDRVQVVAATSEGIVDALPVRAGSRVAAGDVITVLRNPDLDAAVVDARAQLAAAAAEVRSLRETAAASRLDAQGAYSSALAEVKRADAQMRSYAALHDAGLIGDLAYRETTIKAEEDRGLVEIARRKIAVDAAGGDANVAAGVAKVEQFAAQLAARQAQVQTLVVRAPSAGIVQSVAVDRGQRATAGAEIARIARARDLKAVLDVAEGDIHGITPGLPVTIECSGDAPMTGRVVRIAPAALSGSVAVDIALEAVRPGVRLDQSVDGTIELARMHDTLSMTRPPSAVDGSTIALYRVTADGTHAVRTTVRLASGSLDRVAVAAGLRAGDAVIVSDTSAFHAPLVAIR